MKFLYLTILVLSLSFCDIKNKKISLLINNQNFPKDSLNIIVEMNGFEVFNTHVKKSWVAPSGFVKDYYVKFSDSIHFKVVFPQLHIKKDTILIYTPNKNVLSISLKENDYNIKDSSVFYSVELGFISKISDEL